MPFRLSFDDFIRTRRDPSHAPAVERLRRAASAPGDLYKRYYEGDYCVGCEHFLRPDRACRRTLSEHATPTEHVAEENWFFRS